MIPLSIYIHIPFCIQKCYYCDFLSSPSDLETIKIYCNRLIEEIRVKSALYKNYSITTIFIGGGTPTILPVFILTEIINCVKENYNVLLDAEITIESNPGTLDLKYLKGIHSIGVNRLSIGVQSLNDNVLKSIGRIHCAEDFLENYKNARLCGFENINVDLMFALPNYTLSEFKNTLEKLISLKPEHISVYGLILEAGTLLYENVQKQILILPDDDQYLKMYYLAKHLLINSGYFHYEISNFSLPGYNSRHNITYWRCNEYIGFGLGAHSYMNSLRYHNFESMDEYINGDMYQKCDVEEIDSRSKESEFLFMGLRMLDGIKEIDFKRINGNDIDKCYGYELKKLEKELLIERKNGIIRLTQKGIDISNYVFSHFV